jgi:uncharacterized protein (TIGR00730 family)
MNLKSICVYCGSNKGKNPLFVQAANELGRLIAHGNMNLVYGGAKVGLMGAVADSALQNGGTVTGILPRFLSNHKEIPHQNLTELKLVDSMHERKQLLFSHSDAFFVLPGGIGTLEEFTEMTTWLQLGSHNKPICLVNIEGFYDPILKLFENMEKEGFLSNNLIHSLIIEDSVEKCFTKLKQWSLNIEPLKNKWKFD